MPPFLQSATGLVHLTAATVAMLAGAVVVFGRKGSRRHRQIGYVYVVAMAVVIATAFMIYRLYGRFGPFHVLAVIATFSLVKGMVPVMRKNRKPGWLTTHYDRMSWSVVGLYAAFGAETLVRLLPMAQFWPVVLGVTVATMAIGGYVVFRNRARLTGQHQPRVANVAKPSAMA